MNPEEITIEQVEGARWTIAWHPASTHVAVTPALPPYASPELATAWRDRMAATIAQRCHLCDAVADTPAEVKTAPPGETFTGRAQLEHTPDCPCSNSAMADLEVACSPFGTIEQPNMSDEAIERLGAHLRRVNTQLRAAHAATDPEGNTR